MSKIQGVGPIYIGDNPVLHMGSWSFQGGNSVVKFADLQTNTEQVDYGLQSFSGSFEGLAALEDTTGQEILRNSHLNKEKILNLKIYLKYSDVSGEQVIYWRTKAGQGGVVVSSYSEKKDGGSETASISVSFDHDGVMERVTETLP